MSVQFREADRVGGPKKHRCPDCHFCQMCSDARCNACRSGQTGPPARSSAEQIEMFEKLNENDSHPPNRPLCPF
ncbi:MAG: hypothetical protein KKB20_09650 [Proteobacteria bacterium]|nr:hypothetical protein [Pseudomonadota bacterium]